MHIHTSVLIVWELANQEAFKEESLEIDGVHFLFATLLFCDEIFSIQIDKSIDKSSIIEEFRYIRSKCLEILGLTNEDGINLRQTIQSSLRGKESRIAPGLLHRNAQSKKLFSDAVLLAKLEQTDTVSLEHLTLAMKDEFFHNKQYFLNHFFIEKPSNNSTETDKPDASENTLLRSNQGENIDFGRDLTQLALSGELRQIVGREKEITKLEQILLRTTKRNAILVGDPGVGKTAIIEGLAQHLVSRDIPDGLKGLRIIQLEISDIVAGTMYRGSLEKKLTHIIRNIEQIPGAILFLDEIHLVIGSGATHDSSMDIANILKPALTRATFPCIGATTFTEYERYIERDKAFCRRFHIVQIDEPTTIQTGQICRAWVNNIEKNSTIRIPDETIAYTIELTNRFLVNLRQPDKAIDILEDATANLKLRKSDTPSELIELDTGFIRQVVEEKYNIKTKGLITQYQDINTRLKTGLFGQERAIFQIIEELKQLSNNLDTARVDKSLIILAGPDNSSKNTAARIIVDEIFNVKEEILEIDLEDYIQDDDLTRLRGVPPGYVGFDHEGLLGTHISRSTQGAILFLNVEKCPKKIHRFLFNVWGDMKFMDANNRLVDLTNQLCIITVDPQKIESGELMRISSRIVEFSENDIQDAVNYLDDLFVAFRKELFIDKGCDVLLDESSRLNIAIHFTSQNFNKKEFKESFDKYLSNPITMLLTHDEYPPHSLRLSWSSGGIQILREN